MKKTNFLKNEKARVPFSVIGVFLILGSSLTTVYISNLENQKSLEIADSIDSTKIENLLRRAEADMVNALNIAGLKGLKIIGEKPVIEFTNSHGYGSSASEINKNRVKQIIMNNLNKYFKENYYKNRYNESNYALNVVIPSGKSNPITSRNEISIDDSYIMKIKRGFTLDFMGPPSTEEHKTYWKASLPVDVEIQKINPSGKDQLITSRTIKVESLLTSRYNLLKNLAEDYQDEIDGTPCSLWTFSTGLFNIYSLARGFMHWKGGKPKNVVDNDDLHPMVNAGLLMQQGFVFGSVDPWALANVAFSAFGDPSILSDKHDEMNDFVDEIGENMEKGSEVYEIATSKFSSDSSDDSDPYEKKLNYDPQIDIAEIARSPIKRYKTVILHFDHCGNVHLTEPDYNDINKTVMNKRKLGCKLTRTTKKDVVFNQTTQNFIKNLTQDIYTSEFKTILEHGDENISTGDHEGYPIDNGTSEWNYTGYKKIGSIPIIDPYPIKSGDLLYSEKFELEFNRDHFWSNKTTDEGGNVTWNETTAQDKKTETVFLRMTIGDYCKYGKSKNDVYKVLQCFNHPSIPDFNLENTEENYYKNTFTNTNITNWLKDNKPGRVHTGGEIGRIPVDLQDLCFDSLDEIYNQVKKIKQNPKINPSNYPNPADLLEAVKEDLLKKFRENKSSYLSKSDYIKTTGEFKSASFKAIYKTREWYVNNIENEVENYIDDSVNEINNQINDALKKTDAEVNDVKKALSKRTTDELKRQLEIPFGYDMDVDGAWNGLWNEDIKLSVDQKPKYLNINSGIDDEVDKDPDEDYYPLKLRNRCLFGPTGIPILPTPITPWIFTFNIWTVDVAGEYTKFEIKDKTDETLYNVSIGHEAQVYIRQHEMIKSPDGKTIGENTRLNFAWTTIATSFVPAWGRMVGDTEGDIWNEHTDGFD